MTVIDLTERRNAATQPSAEHVRHDDFGRPLYRFLVDYELDGDGWSLELWAYSQEDAQRRVAALRSTATYCGQVFETITG